MRSSSGCKIDWAIETVSGPLETRTALLYVPGDYRSPLCFSIVTDVRIRREGDAIIQPKQMISARCGFGHIKIGKECTVRTVVKQMGKQEQKL